MQRLLAMTLVLLFGLPLITPLFALESSTQGKLLACCRRDGIHHCQSAQDGMNESQGIQLVTHLSCRDAFPKAIGPSNHHDLSFDSAALFFAGVVAHPTMRQQTEARARVALDRSRHKRGPPSVRLS